MSNITLPQSMMRTCVRVKGRTSPFLAPRFLPSRLGRDFETGSPRPTDLTCSGVRAQPRGRMHAQGYLPPSLGDAHAQGKPPSLPSLSPSLPHLLSPHFRNGWVLQCSSGLSWLAGAASQGGGFPLASCHGRGQGAAWRQCTAMR